MTTVLAVGDPFDNGIRFIGPFAEDSPCDAIDYGVEHYPHDDGGGEPWFTPELVPPELSPEKEEARVAAVAASDICWLTISGDLISGLVCTGPFPTSEMAIEYAEQMDAPFEWLVVSIDPPRKGVIDSMLDQYDKDRKKGD